MTRNSNRRPTPASRILLPMLLLVASFAGCVDDPATDGRGDADLGAGHTGVEPVMNTYNGTLHVGLVVAPSLEETSDERTFGVPLNTSDANITRWNLTLDWNPAGEATQELQLVIQATARNNSTAGDDGGSASANNTTIVLNITGGPGLNHTLSRDDLVAGAEHEVIIRAIDSATVPYDQPVTLTIVSGDAALDADDESTATAAGEDPDAGAAARHRSR